MLSSANQQRMDRFRRGSLPLKKRRVSLEPSKSSSFLPYNKSNLHNEVATSEYLMPSMTERSSGLTALSIIAAAAASSDAISYTAAVSPSSMVMMHEQPESFFCHAKTSRGNFFCQRQPCYKGTNYCKQHFCQIEAKKESEDEEESSKAAYTVGQDKRCTGDGNEVRCLATTTRGRTCAYIAVNYTKYCYLHADYETNPPPRRTSKLLSDDSVSKPCRRRTTAKLAEKHATAKTPLLSMISTDQWKGKSVKIASGPLSGHAGTVEKWGNGWVSVSIDGVGLHNRRSFELYIDKDVDEITKNSNPALFRCVSRDIVSPSPTDRFKSSDEEPETPKLNASMSDLVRTPIFKSNGCQAPNKVTPFGNVGKPMSMPSSSDGLDLRLPEYHSKSTIFRPRLPKKRPFVMVKADDEY